MKRSASEKIELSIFYLIIFLILREWLVPIMELTATGYDMQFLLFMAICFAIGVFGLPIILSWPIKILYMTWFTVSVYKDEQLTTWQFLSNELQFNISVLLAGDWVLVSDPLRTSLFFILIWMLIYLIQHWVSVRHTIYYFLVLTVFFIATLDTFTEYDGTVAIIKVMILGLVLTALLFIKRLMQSANMQKDWTSYLKFAMPIIIFVTLAGGVAAFLPKAAPQWPDPVPYMKGMVGLGGTSGNSVSTVGYGNNDESLGGPFVGDNTEVFEIETPIRQYWRVETKDYYTSKGWVHTSDRDVIAHLQFSDPIDFSIAPGNVEPQKVQVNTIVDYDFLLQAYGTTAYRTEDDVATNLSFNYDNEKMHFTLNGEVVKPNNYEITFQQPEYSYTALKETHSSTQADPRYLQLPEQLPKRVKDLAQEITVSSDSVYDKARAIEQYFASNGFRYETSNVAVPEEGEDYVDQFLFETKLGYCDNFSTSMIVLLRSVGIQARWVKGFASGERISTKDGIQTYIVTNNDAHSWVEAYIDGVGWMPFEPTIGFSNPMNIDYDVELDPTQEEQLPERETPEVEKPELKEKELTGKTGSAMGKFNFEKYKWLFYVVGALLILGSIIVWRKRGQWQPKLVVQMNRSKLKDPNNFEEAYIVLLKQLERVHLTRRQHETLQHFAKRVDEQLETTKMTELTAIYEQIIYAGNSQLFDTSKVKDSWEYLINRTSN